MGNCVDYCTEYDTMKIQLRSAALMLAMTLSCVAQSEPNDLKAELERLHNQWFTAFDKGDGATMDRMEVPGLGIS